MLNYFTIKVLFRHDMIACLGETTGAGVLENIRQQMLSSTEGRLVLAEKPRINTSTVDMATLKKLPENSFGFHYVQFLEKHVSACVSSLA